MNLRLTLLALSVLLTACTSAPPKPTTDPTADTLLRSAGSAYSSGQYSQATTLYQSLLNRALAQDSAAAIIDARFNLAISLTAAGQYPQALAQLDRAEAEVQRAKLPADPQLQLLRASVLMRSDKIAEAYTAASQLAWRDDIDTDTSARAHFIAGLGAAALKQTGNLRRHTQFMNQASSAAPADRLELLAHLNAHNDATSRAIEQFNEVIVRRRHSKDFRGMVRALASAAKTLSSTNQSNSAANYYLRAGRSAAQRRQPEARQWLLKARKLGKGNRVLTQEVNALLKLTKRRYQ